MKYGDRGPDVHEMQEALINHGCSLPRHGHDGHFGDETLSALHKFEKRHDLHLTTKKTNVNPKSLKALEGDSRDDDAVPIPPTRTIKDVPLYDLKDEPWKERNPKKFKLIHGKPVIRRAENITGITIHQTAAKYGVAEYQVNAAGGDKELALARRSLRVACHVMAFHDGFVAWPNPLHWYVQHGNGFNSFELGLEIDGNYPGVMGNKTWNGKKSTEVTESVILAARAAIELMVIEGRKMGMPIEYIHAHRQSSGTRRDDPGETLWKRVVLDFAVPVVGLKTEPTRTLGKGKPIPTKWDSNGKGYY